MGVPTSEVGYTSATARRGDQESSYEHVLALEKEKEMFNKRVHLLVKRILILSKCTVKQ